MGETRKDREPRIGEEPRTSSQSKGESGLREHSPGVDGIILAHLLKSGQDVIV